MRSQSLLSLRDHIEFTLNVSAVVSVGSLIFSDHFRCRLLERTPPTNFDRRKYKPRFSPSLTALFVEESDWCVGYSSPEKQLRLRLLLQDKLLGMLPWWCFCGLCFGRGGCESGGVVNKSDDC